MKDIFFLQRFFFCSLNSFGFEEKFGSFPFALNQQFKLAIAMTPNEFRLAIDGEFFTSFIYRSSYGINKINGFKMATEDGMFLEVTSVDHFKLDSHECEHFEQYSHPDIDYE